MRLSSDKAFSSASRKPHNGAVVDTPAKSGATLVSQRDVINPDSPRPCYRFQSDVGERFTGFRRARLLSWAARGRFPGRASAALGLDSAARLDCWCTRGGPRRQWRSARGLAAPPPSPWHFRLEMTTAASVNNASSRPRLDRGAPFVISRFGGRRQKGRLLVFIFFSSFYKWICRFADRCQRPESMGACAAVATRFDSELEQRDPC